MSLLEKLEKSSLKRKREYQEEENECKKCVDYIMYVIEKYITHSTIRIKFDDESEFAGVNLKLVAKLLRKGKVYCSIYSNDTISIPNRWLKKEATTTPDPNLRHNSNVLEEEFLNNYDELKSKEEEEEEISNSENCIVCQSAPKTHIILDCFHFTCCERCILKIMETSGKCPKCRKDILEYKKVFE